MKLVIGGAFQGKKAYAAKAYGIREQDMADGSTAAYEDIFQCRCLYDFHKWLRRGLKEQWDLEEISEQIMRRNPELILISDELGYGVVPVDAFDRMYRETTGRICTALAKNSRQVVRVVCGMGMVIKDEEA